MSPLIIYLKYYAICIIIRTSTNTHLHDYIITRSSKKERKKTLNTLLVFIFKVKLDFKL